MCLVSFFLLIQINRKLHGRTAVHVVCTEGYIDCLKLLLTYDPDLEILVRILQWKVKVVTFPIDLESIIYDQNVFLSTG